MADRIKKPKNYRRGVDREFLRICREEAAAGNTVVVGTVGTCNAAFPCLADIFVYAGLKQPCTACAQNLDEMRKLHGWVRKGKYWASDHLVFEQKMALQKAIENRAAK